MLDFRHETFLALSACGSFTKAADLLHITQPAASQHIKYLEEFYGCKLFNTSDRKIRLNVPCLICPTPHNYIISSNTFFEKNIFEKKVEKYSKNFQKTVDNVFSL